jgi:hypothetical protein
MAAICAGSRECATRRAASTSSGRPDDRVAAGRRGCRSSRAFHALRHANQGPDLHHYLGRNPAITPPSVTPWTALTVRDHPRYPRRVAFQFSAPIRCTELFLAQPDAGCSGWDTAELVTPYCRGPP